MVEFGANNGRTARLILDNVASLKRYVGVEVPHGYITDKAVQRAEVPEKPGELAFSDPRFRLIVSGRGSHDLDDEDIGQVDVAFIDGDHGRKGVIRDTQIAMGCVRPGGIVIWHDYHDLDTVDVRAVLDQRNSEGAAAMRHVKSTWLAFERV